MITFLADPFLAQNAGRRYPFREDDTALPTPFDDTAVLDFRATVRGITAGKLVTAKLTNVTTSVSAKTLTVSLFVENTCVDTLPFVIPLSLATDAPYTAVSAGSVSDGILTVTASVLGLAIGVKSWPFVPTTVVCDALRVDSLQAEGSIGDDDMADPESVLTGDITLDNGRNTEPYLDGNRLRLDIYKGGGIGERCQTPETGQTCDKVLFTINGERPGSDGNLRLVGEDGITVTPGQGAAQAHALVIKIDKTANDRLTETCDPACEGG